LQRAMKVFGYCRKHSSGKTPSWHWPRRAWLSSWGGAGLSALTELGVVGALGVATSYVGKAELKEGD